MFGNDLLVICLGFELFLDKNWSLQLGFEEIALGFDPRNPKAKIRISEA